MQMTLYEFLYTGIGQMIAAYSPNAVFAALVRHLIGLLSSSFDSDAHLLSLPAGEPARHLRLGHLQWRTRTLPADHRLLALLVRRPVFARPLAFFG
jgi:hypothetical protein